jgi:hypothetical protein
LIGWRRSWALRACLRSSHPSEVWSTRVGGHCRSKTLRRGRRGLARWAPHVGHPVKTWDLVTESGVTARWRPDFVAQPPIMALINAAGACRRGPRHGGIRIFPPTSPMIERSWTVFGVSGAMCPPKSVQDLESCAHKRGRPQRRRVRGARNSGFWGKGDQSGGAHRRRRRLPRRNVLDLQQAPTHDDHTSDGVDERRQARSAQPPTTRDSAAAETRHPTPPTAPRTQSAPRPATPADRPSAPGPKPRR